MTRKKFRKLVRAYYTKMHMERPAIRMNMKVFYDIARSAKIQHSVKMNYDESMYQHIYDIIERMQQHIYDVITLKVEP